MAEKLGVPIYLHPKGPPPDMLKPYLDYAALAGPMLGYGAETSLHAMRLICSGVFDKYPRLKNYPRAPWGGAAILDVEAGQTLARWV